MNYWFATDMHHRKNLSPLSSTDQQVFGFSVSVNVLAVLKLLPKWFMKTVYMVFDVCGNHTCRSERDRLEAFA